MIESNWGFVLPLLSKRAACRVPGGEKGKCKSPKAITRPEHFYRIQQFRQGATGAQCRLPGIVDPTWRLAGVAPPGWLASPTEALQQRGGPGALQRSKFLISAASVGGGRSGKRDAAW